MAILLYLAFLLAMATGAFQAARVHGVSSGVPSLYVVLAAVPNGPGIIESPLQLHVVVAALALVPAAPKLIRGVKRLAMPNWLLAYAATIIAAALLSTDIPTSSIQTLKVVSALGAFVAVSALIPQSEVRRAIAIAVLSAMPVILAGAFLLDDAWTELRGVPLWGSALDSPALGLFSTTTAFVGLAGLQIGLVHLKAHQWRALTVITLSAPIILLPLKRAIWLAAAASVIVWVYFEYRNRIWAVLGSALAAGAVFFGVPSVRQLWEREQGRDAPGVENVASIRGGIFEAAIDRFWESPTWGDGLGVGNRGLLIDVGEPGREWAAHSELGTILAGAGAIGALAIVWCYAAMWRGAYRRWRTHTDYVPLLVLTGLVVTLPFHRQLTAPSILSLGLLLIVLPTALDRRASTTSKPTKMQTSSRRLRSKVVAAAGLRGVALAGRAVVGILFARVLGASEVGLLFLAIAVANLLAMLSRRGLDRFALSEISRHPSTARSLSAQVLRKVAVSSVSVSVFGIGVLAVVGVLIDVRTNVFVWALLAIAPINISQVGAHVLRGQERVVPSLLVGAVLGPPVRFFLFIVVLGAQTAHHATAAFFISWTALSIAAVALVRPSSIGGQPSQTPQSANRSLYQDAVNTQLIETVSTVVMALIGLPADVGNFSVANRLQQAVLLPTTSTRFASAPRLASATSEDEPRALSVAVRTARISFWAQLPVAFAAFLFAPQLLQLLGDGFDQGVLWLRVLLVASVVNAMTGSTTQILLVSNHRNELARSSRIALVCLCFCLVAFAPILGPLGVVVAFSIAKVLRELVEWKVVKEKLGGRVDILVVSARSSV